MRILSYKIGICELIHDLYRNWALFSMGLNTVVILCSLAAVHISDVTSYGKLIMIGLKMLI